MPLGSGTHAFRDRPAVLESLGDELTNVHLRQYLPT
jgi:hypothetical protein